MKTSCSMKKTFMSFTLFISIITIISCDNRPKEIQRDFFGGVLSETKEEAFAKEFEQTKALSKSDNMMFDAYNNYNQYGIVEKFLFGGIEWNCKRFYFYDGVLLGIDMIKKSEKGNSENDFKEINLYFNKIYKSFVEDVSPKEISYSDDKTKITISLDENEKEDIILLFIYDKELLNQLSNSAKEQNGNGFSEVQENLIREFWSFTLNETTETDFVKVMNASKLKYSVSNTQYLNKYNIDNDSKFDGFIWNSVSFKFYDGMFCGISLYKATEPVNLLSVFKNINSNLNKKYLHLYRTDVSSENYECFEDLNTVCTASYKLYEEDELGVIEISYADKSLYNKIFKEKSK